MRAYTHASIVLMEAFEEALEKGQLTLESIHGMIEAMIEYSHTHFDEEMNQWQHQHK